MNLDDGYGLLAFLSIFEILGGAALGSVLRSVVRRKLAPTSFFFLIWGLGFAGIPLLMGSAIFLSSGHPAFFTLQAFIFALPILIVGLTPENLFEGLGTSQEYGHALIGGAMTLVGAALILFTAKQGVSIPLIVGAAIGGIGAVILMLAVVRVLHATTT